MRTVGVLLLFGAVVGGASLHPRHRRQDWAFPDDPIVQNTTEWSAPPWFTAFTPGQGRPPEAEAGRQAARTSTRPPGVIFQVKDCDCPAPPQYNPVCGTDGNTYVNRQKLECTRRCGFDVREARMGAC